VAFWAGTAVFHLYLFWVLGVAAVATWIVWAQGTADAEVYKKARRSAQERFDGLNKQWQRETGDVAFKEKTEMLAQSRDALRKLDTEKTARLQELRINARQHQLDRHLKTYRIANARIPNIGAGRITTLRSYSVETAFDVTDAKLTYLPGFGPKLRSNLFHWRQEVEQGFRFDATRAVDPRDVQDIDREFAVKRAQHEQLLRLGPMALKQLAEQALRRRQELAPQVQAAIAALARAQADARAAK
jgi:DNA-binding helix-hairpin-helix protein with protein kinase domain